VIVRPSPIQFDAATLALVCADAKHLLNQRVHVGKLALPRAGATVEVAQLAHHAGRVAQLPLGYLLLADRINLIVANGKLARTQSLLTKSTVGYTDGAICGNCGARHGTVRRDYAQVSIAPIVRLQVVKKSMARLAADLGNVYSRKRKRPAGTS
jgi:hypothetical protein